MAARRLRWRAEAWEPVRARAAGRLEALAARWRRAPGTGGSAAEPGSAKTDSATAAATSEAAPELSSWERLKQAKERAKRK